MPQMAPLNWLSLMIMFITILLIVNCINYYMNLYLPIKNNIKSKSSETNWKW